MRVSTATRMTLLAVVAAIAAAAFFLLPIRDYLVPAFDWIRSTGPWGLLLVIVIYVLASLFLIPGSLITLGAGFAFGLFWGFICVSIGSTLGATAAFLTSRSLLRGWLEPKVTAMPRFAAIDQAVGRQGFKIVLLARLSPVIPFNLLNYALGMTSVSLPSYVAASWLGMLPATLMYVYFGSAIKDVADLASGGRTVSPVRNVMFLVGLLATIAVTVYVTRLARRALDEVVHHG